MTETIKDPQLFKLTTDLVSAYVSNHTVELESIPSIIAQIHQMLSEASHNPRSLRHNSPLKPAVSISESVTDEYIVCLEDGKKLQMLKRHLKTVYNMSIAEYKKRWGLPESYPTVSPAYAKRRSEIAKTSGLGLSGRRKKLKAA
ncbi:MAG: MucR family transcriptional regulator [Alphaproteobacteria bacterium]|nr:MucR family transcriptional regulator [Alphaproteobacteria bacterium]